MQCTTDYPCKINDVNLLVIPMLSKKFNMKVGFSDHTLGYESAIAASAMGAVVIEKHITLNKKMPGPDHKASLNPKEFKEYVALIRNVEKALGKSKKQPTYPKTSRNLSSQKLTQPHNTKIMQPQKKSCNLSTKK